MNFYFIVNSSTLEELVLNDAILSSDDICFIKESGRIWTHGEYFPKENLSKEEVQLMINEAIITSLNTEI